MSSLVPRPHVIPPGGYHYLQGGHRIEGSSYENLAENVLRYRLDNKLPVGNPHSDVLDFVCSRHPHFCMKPRQIVIGDGRLPLTSRVTQWISHMYQTLRGSKLDAMFVGQAVADSRSLVCSACPKNVAWSAGGCGTCHENTKHVAFTFRGGRKAARQDLLRACSVAGHENATAVWLSVFPTLTNEQRQTVPDKCWLKNQ